MKICRNYGGNIYDNSAVVDTTWFKNLGGIGVIISKHWSCSSGNIGMGSSVDVVAGIPETKPRWERDDIGPIYATSAVMDSENFYCYAYQNGGIVLNLRDGEPAWRYASCSPEATRILTKELFIDGLKIFDRKTHEVLCDLENILSLTDAEAMDTRCKYTSYKGAVYAFSPSKSSESIYRIGPDDCQVDKLDLDLQLLPLGIHDNILSAYVIGKSTLVGVDLDTEAIKWQISDLGRATPVLTYDETILLLSEGGASMSLYRMLDGEEIHSHSIDLNSLSENKIVKSWVQRSTSSFGSVVSRADAIYILNAQIESDDGELTTRRYFVNRDISSGELNYSIELATEEQTDTRISLVAGDLVFGFDAEFLDENDNPIILPDAWKKGYRRFCRPCAWDCNTGKKVWEAADAFNSQLHCILSEGALVYIVEHQETVLCYQWREPYRSADLSQ